MKRMFLILSLIFLISSYFTINVCCSTMEEGIKLDKTTYLGYGARPVVTLTDSSLNKNPEKKDEISVIVYSTIDTAGITVKLVESASNTGVFIGNFGLDKIKSDDSTKKLRVAFDDTITVLYKGASGSTGKAGSWTYSSKWKTVTGTVKFSKESYAGLHSSAVVSVSDQDLNLRPEYRDVAQIKLTTDADAKGFLVLAYETGANTGIFSANIKFSINDSDKDREIIKVNPTDKIIAAYIDESNSSGTANSVITAFAGFQLIEAKLETSAVNDEGAGNGLVITVTEPDANSTNNKDRITVKVGSGNSFDDLILTLEETGNSTGIFRGRLSFTYDDDNTSNSLQVSPTGKVNIKYIDRTVPQGGTKELLKTIKWTYESAILKLDKEVYSGYNSSAKITMSNMEMNKDKDARDTVDVRVSSLSLGTIRLRLKETAPDSGDFTGTLYFGRQSKSLSGIIKVGGHDTIVVNYTSPKDKGDVFEISADWLPCDAEITLDRAEYSGDSSPVKITVKDWDMANTSNEKDEIKVTAIKEEGSRETSVTLTETGSNSGVFFGILYINGNTGKLPSITLKPGDRLRIEYNDKETTTGKDVTRAVSAAWKGISEAALSLDETQYIGYDDYMTITLSDPDQNWNITARDRVYVHVKTKNGRTNMEYTLTETGSNTGIFTARLHFTDQPPTTSKIRVNATDEITVTFDDKKISTTAVFSNK